ncbi:hypothetical protein Moror_9170 [Moniliophthora roreri MCA 2997]|nr:hypothetical protein Moror_9170 [Moniliophthora roreri MCA 2997]
MNQSAVPSLSPQMQKIGLAQTGQTPWLHIDILSMVGTNKCTACIVNVLISQKNKSGLAIVARSTIVSASSQLFTVNYDDVLTLNKNLPLHIAYPSSRPYIPHFGYLHPRWKLKDESSFKHLTVNPYLHIRSATPPPDTFNDFDNVLDEVQPSKSKMDDANSEMPIWKHQISFNNENKEEDDIESILEKLRQEKSSSKLSGPELHSPMMVNLAKPSKPVWSDVAHTSHRWVYDLAEKSPDEMIAEASSGFNIGRW